MCVGANRPNKKLRYSPLIAPHVVQQVKQQFVAPPPRPKAVTPPPKYWSSGDDASSSCSSSDRDIHVINSLTGKVEAVYHVHDDIIARGPRKCSYFENLSHVMELESRTDKAIPVRLDKKTALAFPILLDYMYCSCSSSSDGGALLRQDNVLAVRHLANTFKNTPLLSETWNFIRTNMQSKNYEHYMREAKQFDDQQTMSWVAFGCAQDISKISPSSEIWRHMPFKDFRHMTTLICQCRMTNMHSKHLSEIVAAYCAQHIIDDAEEETITGKDFCSITNSKVLPEISSRAAMTLMKMEYHVRREALKEKARNRVMSSLQKRCMCILNATAANATALE